MTALGKSASKISPKSDKELLRKSRLWVGFVVGGGFFSSFLIFTGPACTFLSGAKSLSTLLALSRPWDIPRAKGYGVVGVPCEPQPWGAQSCQGGCCLAMSSRPEPFRASKSSASHGGRNWEEQGREGDGPCARKPVVDGQVRDETLEQEGSAGPFLFCSFPQTSLFSNAKYQTLHRLPSCSPLRLLLLSEMCL